MRPVGTVGTVRPVSVDRALIVLWVAWLLSGAALFVNQVLYGGAGIGPGPGLGIISLIVQAAALIFVARGSTIARAVVIVFFALALLTMQIVGRLIGEGSIVSAIYTTAGFLLKAIGV